jgi:hypothetical protein
LIPASRGVRPAEQRLTGEIPISLPVTERYPPDRVPAAASLPYRVELWDADRAAVEALLALAATPSIGYAAFYAAVQDHPDRCITLRSNDRTLTSVNGPDHPARD